MEGEDRLGFHCHGMDHFEEVILRNGLRRGEFLNFPREETLKLKQEIYRLNLSSSIHVPLVKPYWYPAAATWSFICDEDPDKRKLTLRMVEETLKLASEFKAQYVVVHYPSPELQTDDYHSLEKIGRESAELLSELGKRYSIPIHIEGTGPTPLLNFDFLARVSSFPYLRYCFDCGHMHISSKILGFDLYQMASHMLPYIGSVHVWNNRGLEDYLSFHHIPVHPHQNPNEGWVDIEHFLHIIASQNDCPIILESNPSYPSELGGRDYRDGVEWVKEILS